MTQPLPPGIFMDLSRGAIPAPDPPEPVEVELTFGTEPLTAWRAWSAVDFYRRGGTVEQRLTGITDCTVWPPRQRLTAVCNASGVDYHDAPWTDCTCGVWAVPTREAAEEKVYQDEGAMVFGEVRLWGRVMEFEHGFRAEHAYPASLYVPDDVASPDLVRYDLEHVYGVPATVVPALPAPERPTPSIQVPGHYVFFTSAAPTPAALASLAQNWFTPSPPPVLPWMLRAVGAAVPPDVGDLLDEIGWDRRTGLFQTNTKPPPPVRTPLDLSPEAVAWAIDYLRNLAI